MHVHQYNDKDRKHIFDEPVLKKPTHIDLETKIIKNLANQLMTKYCSVKIGAIPTYKIHTGIYMGFWINRARIGMKNTSAKNDKTK